MDRGRLVKTQRGVELVFSKSETNLFTSMMQSQTLLFYLSFTNSRRIYPAYAYCLVLLINSSSTTNSSNNNNLDLILTNVLFPPLLACCSDSLPYQLLSVDVSACYLLV